MRAFLISAALLTAAAAAAPAAVAQRYAAQPYAAGAQAQVAVSIDPAFAEHARRIGIGDRDLRDLQKDLYDSASRALGRAGQGAPVRADLVITNAVPNRPTFDQYSRTVSLSARSFGLGGASIGGTVTFAEGRTAPVSYRWYETDLRDSFANATWTDADRAFDQFARNLQKGDLQARGYGEASPDAGAFGSRFQNGSRW